MKIIICSLLIVLGAASCSRNAEPADAFGNFEATEVVISSEANGRIVAIAAQEGMTFTTGEILCWVDSSLLILQREEIVAAMNSVSSKKATVDSQNRLLSEQIKNGLLNIERTQNMISEKAAPEKQLDDLKHQVSLFRLQIAANETQKKVISSEMDVLKAKMGLLNEQISRTTVRVPVSGTIQNKFVEKGEITAIGKPLFTISDMKEIRLRAYISGSQLSEIAPGDSCIVRTDKWPDTFFTTKGFVATIAEKAEFTPKIIQTREERVSLVYAVTVIVKNDGSLKNGMPGELIFIKKEQN